MKNSTIFLKTYAITLTFVVAYLVILALKPTGYEEKMKEITVERINIVEPDGKLKMVISNADKQHPGMFNGDLLASRERPPGIIFFNEEEDEVGGLIYHGNAQDGSGMVLSFDQYKNDQVMQMQYLRDGGGKQRYGINFWDRTEEITLPELISIMDSLKQQGITDDQQIADALKTMNKGMPLAVQRLFAGKNDDEQVGLFIKDEFGKDRINIFIDKNNKPRIQFLDKDGIVVKEFLEE